MVSSSTTISIVYGSLLTLFLILTGIQATKRLYQSEFKNNKNWDELKFKKKLEEWIKLVYKLRGVYVSGLIHIYDIATDIIIIIEWSKLAYQQWTYNGKSTDEDYPNGRLSMLGLSISAIIAFTLYRFISAYLVYKYTNKWYRYLSQLFDLDIFRAIYIAHYLERDSVCDLQRWLQKLEAIFESAPQTVLQIVYLTLSDDGINFNNLNSVIVISSLVLSIVSIAQRFTNDDKVFFDYFGGAEALVKLINILKCSGNIVSKEYVQRYLFRITDVFSLAKFLITFKFGDLKNISHVCHFIGRILILSLIWIVFPLGGFALMGVLLVEGLGVLIWASHTNEYNKLQYLVATYFSEFVSENENNGTKNDTKLQTAKFSFIRRLENLFFLIVCIGIVFFDNRYFSNKKQWIVVSKVVIILAVITNSVSASLYFFTHHLLSNDLKSLKGTNERDLKKVIDKGDSQTFLEMILFGFNINIFNKSFTIISDIKIKDIKSLPVFKDVKINDRRKSISQIELSVSLNNNGTENTKNNELITSTLTNNNSTINPKVSNVITYSNNEDEKDDKKVEELKVKSTKKINRKLDFDMEVIKTDDVSLNTYTENESFGRYTNLDSFLKIEISNLFEYFFYQFRNKIIESEKEEKLIINYLFKILNKYHKKYINWDKLLIYYIPSSVLGLRTMLELMNFHDSNFDWKSKFPLKLQINLVNNYYNKMNIKNGEKELLLFYLECINKNNKFNFKYNMELLSVINYKFEINDGKIIVDKQKELSIILPKEYTLNNILDKTMNSLFSLNKYDNEINLTYKVDIKYLDNNQQIVYIPKKTNNIKYHKQIKLRFDHKFIYISILYYINEKYCFAGINNLFGIPQNETLIEDKTNYMEAFSNLPNKLASKSGSMFSNCVGCIRSCCTICSAPDELEPEINRRMRLQREEYDRVIKILLLGTGASGKTTVMKQVRQLYNGYIDEEELLNFRPLIRNQIIEIMSLLSKESMHRQQIFDNNLNKTQFQSLRKNVLLPDNVDYFLNGIDYINENNYIPSFDDYIRCRVKTTGYSSETFEQIIDNHKIRIEFMDIGGQRSERKKWMNFFKDNIDCVIYVISLGTFDEVLYEDRNTNQLQASLGLFEQVKKGGLLENKTVVLFFNKYQIFQTKIKTIPITVALEDYPMNKNPNNEMEVVSFVLSKFEAIYKREYEQNPTTKEITIITENSDAIIDKNKLIMYKTNAIDINSMQKVLKQIINHTYQMKRKNNIINYF